MDMPEVGGQLGEFSFDIEPGAIPVDQGADGKSMSHVHATVDRGRDFSWPVREGRFVGTAWQTYELRIPGNPSDRVRRERTPEWVVQERGDLELQRTFSEPLPCEG